MIENQSYAGCGVNILCSSTGKTWLSASASLVVKLTRISSGMDLTAAHNCTVRLDSSAVEASEFEVSIPAGLAIESNEYGIGL